MIKKYFPVAIPVLVSAILLFTACSDDDSSGGNAIPVTGVTLNEVAITLPAGENRQLTAIVSPTNATNRAVIWSSTDTNVVNVSSNGMITAVFPGFTVVTVTTIESGFTANCSVTINPSFSSVKFFGESVPVTVGASFFNMRYANCSNSISFPTGINDSGSGTLSRKFFLGETEVTTALVATVYQWAYTNGKFSDNTNDHNGISTNIVKTGGQELLLVNNPLCRISFLNDNFIVDAGYEEYPVSRITWYGAIMFCNWLTEMVDGHSDDVVYSGMGTSWDHLNTVADDSRTGFRLPTGAEWEFAARFRGSDMTNTVSGYSYPRFTKGNSASHAVTNYSDSAACIAMAVYNGADLTNCATKASNSLGLYDMSGNINEWCFDASGSSRLKQGGASYSGSTFIQIGYVFSSPPDNSGGFRIARTRN